MKTSQMLAISLFVILSVSRMAAGVTVSSYVTDKYLGFSTGNVLSDHPAVQTDWFTSFHNGFYADMFNSRSLKGSWDDGSLANELDYGLGWTGSVSEGLSLNIGVFYFDEPKVFALGAGDILKTYVTLTKNYKLCQ